MAHKRSLDRRQLAADLLEIVATLKQGDVVDAKDRSCNDRIRFTNELGLTGS